MNNNNLIFTTLNSYISMHKYKKLCIKMSRHIETNPIEDNLKINKINKILKLYTDIISIYQFPLNLHRLAYVWVECRWKVLVKDCGFENMDNTLKYLSLPTNFNLNYKLNTQDQQQFINENDFSRYIKKTIVPIHCQIHKKKNNTAGVKIYGIKPSLPTIEPL